MRKKHKRRMFRRKNAWIWKRFAMIVHWFAFSLFLVCCGFSAKFLLFFLYAITEYWRSGRCCYHVVYSNHPNCVAQWYFSFYTFSCTGLFFFFCFCIEILFAISMLELQLHLHIKFQIVKELQKIVFMHNIFFVFTTFFSDKIEKQSTNGWNE